MEQNFEKIRGFIAEDFVIGFKSKRTGKRVEMPTVDIFGYGPDGKLLRAEAYYQDPAKVGAIA